MKILFLGDVYGQAGKKAVQKHLPNIIEQFTPDIVIANAENTSTDGKSLVRQDYNDLMEAGVEYFTMGNHTFRKEEFKDLVVSVNNIVRPANAWSNEPGKGSLIIEKNGKKILLFNLLGTTFMSEKGLIDPFTVAETILDNNEYDFAILDLHAEATAEKIIIANYLSDRVGAVVGTHTHVPTADNRIINGSTAFITDVGMCGVEDSAIGADFYAVTARMKDGIPGKFIEAQGEATLNSVLITIDEKMKPISIERRQKK